MTFCRGVFELQENSAETTLRMGSIANVINMLKRFPYLLEVEAVVFRNIELHLADLFAGYQVCAPPAGLWRRALVQCVCRKKGGSQLRGFYIR